MPQLNTLNRIELDRLVRQAQQSSRPLHAAVVTTLAYTGVRVGELCGLTICDVELETDLLIVRHRAGTSRQLELNAETCWYLREYLAVRPIPDRVDDDHLFINQRRETITSSGVWRMLARYAGLAGLDGVSPHTLRRTVAARLLHQGHSLDAIADWLGHENVSTTVVLCKSLDRARVYRRARNAGQSTMAAARLADGSM